jgi:hypothetical protein
MFNCVKRSSLLYQKNAQKKLFNVDLWKILRFLKKILNSFLCDRKMALNYDFKRRKRFLLVKTELRVLLKAATFGRIFAAVGWLVRYINTFNLT